MTGAALSTSPLHLIGLAFGTVRRSLRPMLWYELFFKLLAAAILTPLVTRALSVFIRSTGSVAISNEAIAGFLVSPRGVTALIVVGTVSFGIIFMELAGLMVIAAATLRGETGEPVAALRHVGRRFPRLLQLGLLELLGAALVVTPFLIGMWYTYRLLISASDINYYLAERPPEFWLALAIATLLGLVALLLAAILYVCWMLALPILLFENTGPWGALRRSYRLVRPAWRTVTVAILSWFALALLLSAGANALFDIISDVTLKVVGDRTAYVVAAVATLIALYTVGAIVISAVAATVDAALVVQIYQARGGSLDEASAPVAASARTGGGRLVSTPRLIWIVVLAFLAVTAGASVTVVRRLNLDRQVEVTAHRGSSLAAPENTLSAFRQAIEDGADFAELDVQLTADSVVVVMHDADFQRLSGVAQAVSDLTYEEIRALDIGTWFSPEFAAEYAPTLQQAMDLARGRIKLNIELKVKGDFTGLVERVVDLIELNEFQQECVITSLDHDAVLAAKELAPDLQVGAIVATAIGDVTRLPVDLVSAGTQLVSRHFVRRAHQRGMEVHVWTVNDREQMWTMIEVGVDNIITDVPATVAEVLEERAALDNTQKVLMGFRSWMAR